MSVTYDARAIQPAPARTITELAAVQHGVITRGQALGLGASGKTIDRRVSRGVWEALHSGVYRLAGSPPTWRQSLLAICLAWGDGVGISHRPAAALWTLPRFGRGKPELSVPRGRQRAAAGIIHRPASLAPVDLTVVDAIPVTTPARTLIDLAGCVPSDVLEESLDDALRRRLVTLARLRWRLEELGTAGRKGTKVLTELIEARTGMTSVPQSVFETRLLRVLRGARLPAPVVQHRVRTHGGVAVLDFAYIEQRVAIEADGFRWQSSRRQWDLDRERNNALTMLGWTIIRVTWTQLRERPDGIVEAVRSTLLGRNYS